MLKYILTNIKGARIARFNHIHSLLWVLVMLFYLLVWSSSSLGFLLQRLGKIIIWAQLILLDAALLAMEHLVEIMAMSLFLLFFTASAFFIAAAEFFIRVAWHWVPLFLFWDLLFVRGWFGFVILFLLWVIILIEHMLGKIWICVVSSLVFFMFSILIEIHGLFRNL